ncbi:MAG: NAD-dependent epimerase/dehydratase family protein [Pseudomonadota bacterium]
MPKRALVTGAAGFIGRYVVAALEAAGWSVTGYDVQPQPANIDCRWVKASILDGAALTEAMEGCSHVFHLAAHAHLSAPKPDIYQQINVEGSRQVLHAAAHSEVDHLIVTSSAVIWQAPGAHGEITEQSPLPARGDLAGPYARSKWDLDALLKQHAGAIPRLTTLYPTVPIGAGDYGFTAPTQMLDMFLKNPPPAVLRTVFNFVPVCDLAQAHVLAASAPGPAQARYLLSGETWSMNDVLASLSAITEREMPSRAVPYWLARLAAGVSEPVAHLRGHHALSSVEGVRLARSEVRFRHAAAMAQLGWAPTPVIDALKQAVAWLSKTSRLV